MFVDATGVKRWLSTRNQPFRVFVYARDASANTNLIGNPRTPNPRTPTLASGAEGSTTQHVHIFELLVSNG